MLLKCKSFLSLSLVFKLLITAGAYGYIYYHIDSSLSESESFSLISPWTQKKTTALTITFILMIFNWLMESIKWKNLLHSVENISITQSIKSVLVGITCSIFTPYRIGEYFGRPILITKEKRSEAIVANFIGSLSQNIVTFGLGILGITQLIINHSEQTLPINSRIIVLVALFGLSLLLLIFYFSPKLLIRLIKIVPSSGKLVKKLEFVKKYTKRELLNILLLSFIRYVVFFSQYYLLLLLFDIDIRLIDAFSAISLSYVFLFSIPGIPIVDIGIRGSLALFFLGMYSANDIAIISASSTLWIINLAIPSIAGSYFLIKNKIVEG